MPRFIKNGPSVPDQLVQELEEDRVIIFCGAGISAGGGLPNFRELVAYCYEELGVDAPAAKDPAWHWLDRMLGSLESDFPDQMRAKVVEALDKTATDLTIHDAILKLARLKGGANGYRLVTTNFDLFFEQANPRLALGVDYHSGPILPIPRNDRIASWRSIVYLHGRLNAGSTDNEHLVLTSGDFGRAYLTDAWAARFVARLFAEFTVLFIGYSLNDPVLRYMTDAFAAEDALSRSGKRRGPAYIFVPYKGSEPPPESWRQRQLEPIFYRQAYQHRALTNTLVEWAKARTDYLASVDTIVRRYGTRLPSALEPSYAANVVWSVCGRSGDKGHGARVFASLEDAPPIEWLSEFEQRDAEAKAAHAKDIDLAAKDRDPPPSPPYHIKLLFPKGMDGHLGIKLSDTATQLIPWLCRHLENPQLVNWVIQKLEQGRRAHPSLRWAIRRKLEGEPAIAQGFLTFWRIVASEGAWASDSQSHMTWADLGQGISTKLGSGWFDRELAAAMRPYLTLGPSYRSASGGTVDPARFSTIADAEVKLAHSHLSHLIGEIDAVSSDSQPNQFWADRLNWLTELLTQIFDLYAAVDKADANYDPSMHQRPSIPPHAQNAHHANWATLYDLIWRGWQVIDADQPELSRHWVERWRKVPYLGFRRLSLAAVAHSANFTPAEKLEALLDG